MTVPDPRLHIALTQDNRLILDVIEGAWPNEGRVVYSLSVDADDMIGAIINIEHLIPCEIRTIELANATPTEEDNR